MYRWAMCLLLLGCAGASHVPRPVTPEADGPQLWMQVAGDGEPTVVFADGGGDDSSVWAGVEPQVRLRSGVRTVVYDRARRGKRPPATGPDKVDAKVDAKVNSNVDDEIAALDKALARFGIKGPLILVAHAYGGLVAERMAASHPRVVGVVLVDAYLSPPAATAAYPAQLPTVDIVAEHSWGETDEANDAMRAVHAAFVAGSPAREAVLATGGGHQVMRDQPEVVVAAVARILQRIHATP